MSFLSRAFGTESAAPAINYSPSGFSGGGLTGSYSGNNFNVTADANRTGTVNNLAGTYGDLGSQYGDLLKTVQPGASASLAAQLQDQENQAKAAVGNLQQNLQSRRILGSSFGEDTLSRLKSQIAQNRSQTIAQNYQQELQNTQQLIAQQHAAYAQQYQTGLDELNLEAGQAANLNSTGSQILAKNAQTLAQLGTQNNQFNADMNYKIGAGAGSFIGKLGMMALG